jgi:hypothetical protein
VKRLEEGSEELVVVAEWWQGSLLSPFSGKTLRQEVKELFKKKHIYYKYAEIKVILLFNVINVTTTHYTLHYTILHYTKIAV